MNPSLPKTGNKPESNQILEIERSLLDSKREKVIEIFRQCQDIFDLLESAKKEPVLKD